MSMGGTEIANSSRFMTYVSELVPGLQVEDCYDCADLGEILGDGPYNTPLVDQPDWYSARNPDSADFCGFYPLEVEGIDDGTRTASVTELALDGAMVGAPRYASREIRVTGLLVGATDAAVTFGLRWLAKALEGSACRDATGCTGDHFCYYAACPPMCTDSPALDDWDPDEGGSPLPFYLCDDGMITTVARACSVDYERTLYQVTLTSGPTVVEQYNSTCGAMLRIEFTLVAGVPFAFSTAIAAAPGTAPILDPVTVADIACIPGTDVAVRTNLATNPVPNGNAAVAGGGWQPDGTGFTVTPDSDVVYDPTGGASVRITRTEASPRPNLAANPGPTGDLTGWGWQLGQGLVDPTPQRVNKHINPRLQGAPVAGTATAADVATGGPDGGSWRRLTVTANTAAVVQVGHTATYMMPVTPGKPVMLSSYAYASTARQVRMFIRRYDSAGDQIGADSGSPIVTLTPGQWSRMTFQHVPPAGNTQILVRVSFVAPLTAGDILGATMVLAEEDTTEFGPYFDGDTPDGGGYAYTWTGAARASTSVAAAVAPAVTTALVSDPGGGPGGQDTFARATVVHEKVGGQDGFTYDHSTGPGLYTLDWQVRLSAPLRVQLLVTALDAAGTVLASVSGPTLTATVDTWEALGPVRIDAPPGTVRLRLAALLTADSVLPQGETFDAGAVRIYSGLAINDTLIGAVTYVGQHDDATTTIPVTAGTAVTASVYAGASVDAVAVATVTFYTAAGLPVMARTGAAAPLAPSLVGVARWRRPAVVAAVPPATAAYMVIDAAVHVVRPEGAQVGDAAWLTSVLVEEASAVLSYFDGSTEDNDSMSYEWTGTPDQSTSQAILHLPADDDGGRIVDPDCDPVPPPPRPPVIDVSCVDTPATWRRYQVQVSEDLVPLWFDAVPIVRLQTADTAARQVRIRFYPNPLGAPINALDPCSYCGEFVVTYIPPHAQMTIDGIRQWVTVTSSTGVVSTANHLLASTDGGPVSWPLLGCGVGYTLVLDVSPTDVAGLVPQICLAARA